MINEWAIKYGIPAAAVVELLALLSPVRVDTGTAGTSSESKVQKQIRLVTNLTGGLLLRNNSGVARELREGGRLAYVRYGLGNESEKLNKTFKSSDLIGITPVVIRPEHVGRTWGIFTAIETKRTGWKYCGNPREKGQLFFINAIRARGGIAAFATDSAHYVGAIHGFIEGC